MPDEEVIVEEPVDEEPVDEPGEEPVEPEIEPADGVSFDGWHSYLGAGLRFAKRPDLGSPKPKLNLVDVPGMDGLLDFTEANAGEVKFYNRTMTFTFSAMVDAADQPEFMMDIMERLHGRLIEQIILDNDPNWYYTGRAYVVFKDVMAWKLKCVITVDADPYAYKLERTEISLSPVDRYFTDQYIDLAKNTEPQTVTYSRFQLGTKEFPEGVPTGFGVDRLKIRYYGFTSGVGILVTVTDADGNSLIKSVATAQAAGNIEVTYTELTNANVDLSRIWEVRVTGAGNAYLFVVARLARIEIDNARKTAIPQFVLTAPNPCDIIVDGVEYTVQPRGVQQTTDIVLHSGENYVLIAENTPTDFTMSWQEGKL